MSVRRWFGFGAALVAAGCSSQGGAQQNSTEATAQRYTIAMITHEQPGDSFWYKIRAGAQQAATQLNVYLK